MIRVQPGPLDVRGCVIAGPLHDSVWVVGSPLIAWGVLEASWRWSGSSDLAIFGLLFAFVVTGHHLPGWLRAFGEPSVHGRHKVRLWTSLAAVPALVILPTAFGLGALALCVAALFDLWHVALQQHGFGRIYGAKARDGGHGTARLDLLCILTWYATLVAWSDAWMHGIAAALRHAGLPLFSAFSPAADSDRGRLLI